MKSQLTPAPELCQAGGSVSMPEKENSFAWHEEKNKELTGAGQALQNGLGWSQRDGGGSPQSE